MRHDCGGDGGSVSSAGGKLRVRRDADASVARRRTAESVHGGRGSTTAGAGAAGAARQLDEDEVEDAAAAAA